MKKTVIILAMLLMATMAFGQDKVNKRVMLDSLNRVQTILGPATSTENYSTENYGASKYGAAYDIGAFEYGVGRLVRIGTTIPTINYKIILIDH